MCHLCVFSRRPLEPNWMSHLDHLSRSASLSTQRRAICFDLTHSTLIRLHSFFFPLLKCHLRQSNKHTRWNICHYPYIEWQINFPLNRREWMLIHMWENHKYDDTIDSSIKLHASKWRMENFCLNLHTVQFTPMDNSEWFQPFLAINRIPNQILFVWFVSIYKLPIHWHFFADSLYGRKNSLTHLNSVQDK